ncbi:Mu transposase C-terminal domain-containing protein [Clostridium thermopalmarium]|jgi:hypothetical protein|uniref:Transposon Tn7 transposition protein TnsB n=1 Tax=Clostridium thermopalmarium DSM 5974 TaxID=1121340 RepID=A0A2T0AMM3_9CLOT|nr:Mu transposase C-terminal domain-containing protein [Clostridium thermopalmarium]PRR70119.1 Transposon Tn7 transposition protein TnsB [Clostridium thermopalmarium DSM 5974]PVZ23134.1 Mu transposase-like protein [Clostridium thermopalmarium DSM 5974]
MDKFYVNDLFQVVDNENIEDGAIKRILWIEEDYTYCFIIDISSPKALPEIVHINDLHTKLENSKIIRVNSDPYFKNVDKENNSEGYKARIGKAIKVINLIAREDNEPDIYNESTRGNLVKKAIKQLNISKPSIYKYLRRYWQGGKRDTALLPHYDVCGLKGKEKRITGAKRGRPNKNEQIQGINIDKNIETIFKSSIKKWYNNPKQIKLSKVYQLMLEKYFSVNGNLFPEGKYPTMGQFYYWYHKLKDEVNEKKRRFSDKYYNLNNRPLLSNTNSEVFGPGSRFEIDASYSKVYLVSRLDRNQVIGKAVVYLIVDVFSRMITGLYVGFENPSWTAASMALANMVEDKVAFCKRYGIDITEDQWPCKYVPSIILADKGEFKWHMPESLAENLNITIENTASSRPDMKPNVERGFGIIRSHFEFLLDGVVTKKIRERGEKDHRTEAIIDIYQFTQIVINIVLYMNNHRWIDSYNLTKEMIEDGVRPIPIELWNYGIENCSGKLMSVQEDIFKFNLLSKETVTICREGVRFIGLYYYFENQKYNDLILKAGVSGSKKIEIRYDKRDISYIYIYDHETRTIERAALLGKSKQYEGMSYDEVKEVMSNYRLQKSKYEHEQIQANIYLNRQIQNIMGKAKDMSGRTVEKHNKRLKVSDMKEHRKEEKERVRKEEKFVFLNQENENIQNIEKPKTDVIAEYYSNDNIGEILKEIMEEKE